ncbi:glutathione S-transferase family protein [Phyllobacterium sp. LjRoot231]|uniref:glutathione S-transferase family protein n=1 Tax=Phyllobacterium sp. LjRoot231 TaxID=3342289 RepID=UPI003ECF74FA
MSLKLYFHPLSSYCMKVLTALYEKDLPFEAIIVNFGDATENARFIEMWPIRKFPLLRDEARNRLIPESTPIIEYLEMYYPGKAQLLPTDPEMAYEARWFDRFFDLHVHTHMQKIVGDKLRPEDKKDPFGVEEATTKLRTAYAVLENRLKDSVWAAGDQYTLADCSASPALFYANLTVPLGSEHRNVSGYLDRLMNRPSFARAVEEAQPYFHMRPE